MTQEEFERRMDELVMAQAEQCAKEQKEREANGIADDEIREGAKGALKKFLSYIQSFKFTMKCKKASLKTGADYKIIKNCFVANILGKIADVLGLVLNFTGNIIEYAINFVSNIIINIVSFTTDVLLKLVNVLTLNCGTQLN